MGILIFYILVALGVFLSSCSQIFLKQSANKQHNSKIAEILNLKVLLAYSIFFTSVIINIISLSHGVGVKDLPIIESLGYIFVPILSLIFLGEKIKRHHIIAICLILSGIIIFYI